MERVVPYTSGMILGDLYDARKCDILRNCAYKFRETHKIIKPVDELESKFSFTESIDDICDILMIPKEYALKVWTGHIINEGVKQALLTLYVPHSETLMIRKTYVKETVSLTDRDASMEESYKDLKASQDEDKPTHWVKSMDIGDEIVIILHFLDNDGSIIQSIRDDIYKALETSSGVLDPKKQTDLTENLQDFDRMIKRGFLKGLECKIFVFGFHEYDVENLRDVAKMLDIFSKNEEKWEQQKEYKTTNDVIKFKEYHAWNEASPGSTDLKMFEGQFYNLRVTIKNLQSELSTNQEYLQCDHPEAKGYYSLLLAFYTDYPEASKKLESILERQEFSFMSEDANKLQENIEEHGLNATLTIAGLDLRYIDTSHFTGLKGVSNVVKTVDDFIKRKTEQLPSGQPIQLLLLGKTGHGKSSTGNSILRKSVFEASNSTQSGTITASTNSAIVDSRLITCVDTPGVYNTSEQTADSKIYAEAIQAISLAITHCSQGIHAILLVFAYGVKMTKEEQKCIEMLTSLFGENILEEHVIIVMTKGDNLKKDNESFSDWLSGDQNKCFKKVLKACDNRCVLFDNKTEDEKCMKEQLVILVNYIDSLGRVPYTNQMFKDAERMRAELFSDSILLDNIFTSSCKSLYEDLKQLKSDEPISPSIEAQVNDLFIILGNPNKGTQIYNLFSAVWNVKNQIEVKRTSRDTMLKEDKSVLELMTCLVETVDEINAVDEKVTPEVAKEVNCFPEFSVVILENGDVVRMKNLNTGMRVLAFDKNKGLFYDEIYMFGHREHGVMSKFVVIHSKTSHLTISPEHLILCKKNGIERFVSAKNVKVGDEILTKSELGFVWSSVADVTYRVDRGLYAPFTRSGTIVVDGVVASCYIDVLPHDVCHRMVSPIRCLYRVSPSLVRRVCGVSDTQPVPKIARLALTILGFGKKINQI
ncbi:uncharacterized protein LOC131950339 [Physella acuta]|uniref:uncharacterized protein LOC131950339 n=1 Tax=Physella acuta TaxID=109671 RepID=UPI0027DDEB75|nr:uncharacterized protein LOC131950339 [Physella acuta]